MPMYSTRDDGHDVCPVINNQCFLAHESSEKRGISVQLSVRQCSAWRCCAAGRQMNPHQFQLRSKVSLNGFQQKMSLIPSHACGRHADRRSWFSTVRADGISEAVMVADARGAVTSGTGRPRMSNLAINTVRRLSGHFLSQVPPDFRGKSNAKK